MRRLAAVVACFALTALACGHGSGKHLATLTSSSDDVVFEAGQKLATKHQWEDARQHFKRVVEGFPQSQHIAEARIGLADAYFNQGGDADYILAVSEYRAFLTLYPSNPKSEYAQFQVGQSFDRQRHGPDRDMSQTEKALEEYQRLLELYPSSTYVEQTRARIVDCRQNLARASFMVGYFYQKSRRACRAALTRYDSVEKDYPDYARMDEVLFRASQCLNVMGRFAEALPRISKMLEQYPKSPLAAPARKLADELRVTVQSVPPPPSPTPSASPTPAASTSPPAPPAPSPAPQG
jgi:outer membrane protein assembly factor BamD